MKTCAYWFVIIGGLNWLLVGVANFDLVDFLLGGFAGGMIARVVYIIVGLSAVLLLVKGGCKSCKVEKSGSSESQSEMPMSDNQGM
jgi:uncharacterized membrane protein YuzA (DUF378 family)